MQVLKLEIIAINDDAMAVAFCKAGQVLKDGSPIDFTYEDENGIKLRLTLTEHDEKGNVGDIGNERRIAADIAFSAAEIGDVEDSDGWNIDGVYWSCRVYYKNPDPDGDSIAGSYGVQFAPDTAEIVDSWHQ